VRCYREVPGDADCHDVPAFGESLDDVIMLADQMLLAYANNAKRAPASRPSRADLVDEKGEVIARIRVTGPDQVERVLD
jgi:hypothetical protein